MDQNKPAFGATDIVTILLLIFIFPIGVILAWFITKWPKWFKITLTILLLVSAIFVILQVAILSDLTSRNINDVDRSSETKVISKVPVLNKQYENVRQAEIDSTRKFDIRNLQAALELYNADKNSYPRQLENLVPLYIKQLPLDPSTKQRYGYKVGSKLTTYTLTATLSTGEKFSATPPKNN